MNDYRGNIYLFFFIKGYPLEATCWLQYKIESNIDTCCILYLHRVFQNNYRKTFHLKLIIIHNKFSLFVGYTVTVYFISRIKCIVLELNKQLFTRLFSHNSARKTYLHRIIVKFGNTLYISSYLTSISQYFTCTPIIRTINIHRRLQPFQERGLTKKNRNIYLETLVKKISIAIYDLKVV